jgi:hypothetical protein
MNILYLSMGIAMVLFGIYTTFVQVKIFNKGEEDNRGQDYKILSSGLLFIVVGILIIIKYI